MSQSNGDYGVIVALEFVELSDPEHNRIVAQKYMKKKIETTKAPLPGASPHSQAIVTDNLVFTQGSICLTPEGKLLEGTVEEQIHQTMRNLSAILKASGCTFSDVIKTTIYVTNMSLYGKINEIYGEYMSDPYPARETVCVKELPLGAQVEISMIADKS